MYNIIDGKCIVAEGIEKNRRIFFEDKSFMSIDFPPSVELIDFFAFIGCTNLRVVYLRYEKFHVGFQNAHMVHSVKWGCQSDYLDDI